MSSAVPQPNGFCLPQSVHRPASRCFKLVFARWKQQQQMQTRDLTMKPEIYDDDNLLYGEERPSLIWIHNLQLPPESSS